MYLQLNPLIENINHTSIKNGYNMIVSCAYCGETIPTIEKDNKIIVSTLYWNKTLQEHYCNALCSFNQHSKHQEEQKNGEYQIKT